ncbi:hypothetical protein [Iningainema tapete]|uniref:Uncharacterized protein n=1 Tax=Iningainema tapete BLCC-T55 TaxID=2748662 RepID=A0A8J7BX50_9CYAN|nr:hypothetical protein [Iningainema tapete]MBD2773057.1 hypothetical protein [Iningainema tapete BLCC-T55]
MSTQFFLDELDIEKLAKIVLRSQQVRTREALCMRIGVDPRRLWFIRDSSDSDFVIQLINHLNEVSNKESLCKLCCEELLPIFRNSETSAAILEEIAVKLNCQQKLSHAHVNSSQHQTPTPTQIFPGYMFGKSLSNLIIISGLIVGLGGGLVYYFTSQKQQAPLGSYQHTCPDISVKNSFLTAKCYDRQGQLKQSTLNFEQCRDGIENQDGRLICK